MTTVSTKQRSGRIRRGTVTLAATVFAVLVMLQLLGGSAPADNLQRKLDRGQAKLDKVKQKRGDLAASIDQRNSEIDALIGEVAALQGQRAQVEQELAAKQAELDRTTAALEKQRKHLEVVRGQLKRALGVLRRWLVTVYVSGNPDVLSVIANSASWSDVVAQSEYLGQIKDYEGSVVERVQQIRDQTKAAVRRLAATREQVSAARDAIAAEQQQLANAEAALQSRHAQLVAAQDARQQALDSLESRASALRSNLSSISADVAAKQAESAVTSPAPPAPAPAPVSVPGETATLLPNGQAAAPASAPAAVKAAIAAANSIATTPYIWGGGHGSFSSPGYDCSGAVSFALNGGGFLSSPLDSTGLETWGDPGAGSWITVYANSGHTFAVIAGLRWDTSGDISGTGPRWHSDMASTAGFIARHPSGY